MYCEHCGKEMRVVGRKYNRLTGAVKALIFTCPDWKTYSQHDIYYEVEQPKEKHHDDARAAY